MAKENYKIYKIHHSVRINVNNMFAERLGFKLIEDSEDECELILKEKEDYTVKLALRGAVLRDADLRGVKNLPQDYINQCSRDMLFIFQHLKSELPFLREKLVNGEVDGTQYEGDCACLIGTLANADGGIKKVCEAVPYYDKGLHNYGEQWFWQIRKGDTPENNDFAKHALLLIDKVLDKGVYADEVAKIKITK